MKTRTPSKRPAALHRVLLVDDHPMTRDGMAQLIRQERDLEITGEAGTAQEAIQMAKRTKPDFAVVDVTLPDQSGIDLIKELKALNPAIQVLVVSMHDEGLYAERALRAGARGYLSKQEGGSRLMHAIRQVMQGDVFVSEATRRQILESLSNGSRQSSSSASLGGLTDRELNIFRLIGAGVGTTDIAARLGISAKTVETHRLNIKKKLKLNSAWELTAYAARWAGSHGESYPAAPLSGAS